MGIWMVGGSRCIECFAARWQVNHFWYKHLPIVAKCWNFLVFPFSFSVIWIIAVVCRSWHASCWKILPWNAKIFANFIYCFEIGVFLVVGVYFSVDFSVYSYSIFRYLFYSYINYVPYHSKCVYSRKVHSRSCFRVHSFFAHCFLFFISHHHMFSFRYVLVLLFCNEWELYLCHQYSHCCS